jgi:hypothetical protein
MALKNNLIDLRDDGSKSIPVDAFTNDQLDTIILPLFPTALSDASDIVNSEIILIPEVGLSITFGWQNGVSWEPQQDKEGFGTDVDVGPVTELSATLFIASDPTAERFSILIFGKISFGGQSDISLSASYPAGLISFTVQNPTKILINTFLGELFPNNNNLEWLNNFPVKSGVNITSITFLANISTKALTLDLGLEGNLADDVSDPKFTLDNLNLRVIYLGGEQSEIIGTLNGMAAIGDSTALAVSADYAGQENGWQFTGQVNLKPPNNQSETPVTNETPSLATTLQPYGVTNPPDFLDTIDAAELELSFAVKDGSYDRNSLVVTCEGILFITKQPLSTGDPTTVELMIALTITPGS